MLSEEDATELLSTMLHVKETYILRDLAPLLVYYGLFRERSGSFDSLFFQQTLKAQLVSGEPGLRESLAWHFWDILRKKELMIHDIVPYLRLFWVGTYDQGLAAMFDLLWEQLLTTAPDLGSELFERMVKNLREFVEQHPEQARELWVTKAAEMMPSFAARPAAMIDIIQQLAEIRRQGVFIFDMADMLTSFRHVHPNHREAVRAASLAVEPIS
jgi:hypothetical protein